MQRSVLAILFPALLLCGCTKNTKTVEETVQPVKRPVQWVISPETTFLTEPLLSDGCIDYRAAINELLAAQTTPENNLIAGVYSLIPGDTDPALMAQPDAERDKESPVYKYRERFWKMLGFDTPPPLDSLVSLVPDSRWNAERYKKGLNESFSEEEYAAMIAEQREHVKELLQTHFESGDRIVICCGRVSVNKGGGMTKEEYEEELQRIESKTDDEYFLDVVQEQWNESLDHPWTEKEYPFLAHWLTATDELAQKIIDISKQRTGYYHPLLSYEGEPDLLHNSILPYMQGIRWAARHFQCRGNFEFAKGNLDRAMECVFSSLRMSRTMRAGSGFPVEDLTGIAILRLGNHQLTRYLADLSQDKNKGNDAAWILQKKKEFDDIVMDNDPLSSQPTWHFVALLVSERLGMLDTIQAVAMESKAAREFMANFFENDEEGKEKTAKFEELFFSDKEYDWAEIMRRVNLSYDEMEDVYLLPTWQRRLRAAQRLEQRISEHTELINNSSVSPERRAAAFLIESFVLPALEPLQAMAGFEWECRIADVAFALAAYRADNDGSSPDTLEQLVPKYLDSVPDSPYTDKPLRYIKRQDDVLITRDDTYQLDGSEEDVEKQIAEAKPGSRIFLGARQVIFVAAKNPAR